MIGYLVFLIYHFLYVQFDLKIWIITLIFYIHLVEDAPFMIGAPFYFIHLALNRVTFQILISLIFFSSHLALVLLFLSDISSEKEKGLIIAKNTPTTPLGYLCYLTYFLDFFCYRFQFCLSFWSKGVCLILRVC